MRLQSINLEAENAKPEAQGPNKDQGKNGEKASGFVTPQGEVA